MHGVLGAVVDRVEGHLEERLGAGQLARRLGVLHSDPVLEAPRAGGPRLGDLLVGLAGVAGQVRGGAEVARLGQERLPAQEHVGVVGLDQVQVVEPGVEGLAPPGARVGEDLPPVDRVGPGHVLQEIMNSPDKGIPQDLLDKAHCIAVVPGLKTGGFMVGAKYGKGVLACRKVGGGWRGPATVRIEGGSVGFQIGAGEVDTVLLIMNQSGAEKMMRSEFKIGGEAAAMGGPVGRNVQAETDAYMRAEILGYSRSRGVFAGVAITGSTLREDLDDNTAIYNVCVRAIPGLTAAPV